MNVVGALPRVRHPRWRHRYGFGTEILLDRVIRSSSRSITIDVLLSGAEASADVGVEGAFQKEESEFARVCDSAHRVTRSLPVAILRYSSHAAVHHAMHDVPDSRPAIDRGHPVAIAYEVHRDLLQVIAEQKFHVPPDDAGPLVNDVFLSYLRNHLRVRDERAWLIAAICNAAREYWYHRGQRQRLLEVQAADAVTIDRLSERVALAQVLARLPERCRTALWLRLVEGRTPEELAVLLATTVANARQIVHRCKTHARALFEAHHQRH